MQDIILYIAAGQVLADIRDSSNARCAAAPSFALGVEVRFLLRLFKDLDSMDPYPISVLDSIASWRWVMDRDYDHASTVIFIGDNANIVAETISESISGKAKTFTQITIPLTSTNTAEAIAALGTSQEITLGGELVGYDTNGSAIFIQQIEGFRLRNRRDSVGTPIALPETYYTKEQVDALLAGVSGGNMSVEFSVNGSVWTANSTGAYFWRFRISETAAWSAAIPIPQPSAVAGAVSYSFTVATGSTATQQAVTWSQLGTAGKTPVRLYQVQSDNSELDITANSRLQIVLNASGVTLFWANDAFPAGNYVIRG